MRLFLLEAGLAMRDALRRPVHGINAAVQGTAIAAVSVAGILSIGALGGLSGAPIPRPEPTPSPGGGMSGGTAQYNFMEIGHSGEPAAFPLCIPLVVTYYPDGEPYPARVDVSGAVADLAGAMHRPIALVDGPQAPTSSLIEIAWVPTAADLPGAGDTDGVVGQTATHSRDNTYRHNEIALVRDGDVRPGDGPASWTAVIRHELAHAVGLDHAPRGTPNTVMTPTLSPTQDGQYGTADREGLARLGGPCPNGNPTKEPR